MAQSIAELIAIKNANMRDLAHLRAQHQNLKAGQPHSSANYAQTDWSTFRPYTTTVGPESTPVSSQPFTVTTTDNITADPNNNMNIWVGDPPPASQPYIGDAPPWYTDEPGPYIGDPGPFRPWQPQPLPGTYRPWGPPQPVQEPPPPWGPNTGAIWPPGSEPQVMPHQIDEESLNDVLREIARQNEAARAMREAAQATRDREEVEELKKRLKELEDKIAEAEAKQKEIDKQIEETKDKERKIDLDL